MRRTRNAIVFWCKHSAKRGGVPDDEVHDLLLTYFTPRRACICALHSVHSCKTKLHIARLWGLLLRRCTVRWLAFVRFDVSRHRMLLNPPDS